MDPIERSEAPTLRPLGEPAIHAVHMPCRSNQVKAKIFIQHLKDYIGCPRIGTGIRKSWSWHTQADCLILDASPQTPVLRKQTVEHPFGTIKMWMGATHFLMRRFKNVSTEISLHVLAYNLKRMMSIWGTEGLIVK